MQTLYVLLVTILPPLRQTAELEMSILSAATAVQFVAMLAMLSATHSLSNGEAIWTLHGSTATEGNVIPIKATYGRHNCFQILSNRTGDKHDFHFIKSTGDETCSHHTFTNFLFKICISKCRLEVREQKDYNMYYS